MVGQLPWNWRCSIDLEQRSGDSKWGSKRSQVRDSTGICRGFRNQMKLVLSITHKSVNTSEGKRAEWRSRRLHSGDESPDRHVNIWAPHPAQETLSRRCFSSNMGLQHLLTAALHTHTVPLLSWQGSSEAGLMNASCVPSLPQYLHRSDQFLMQEHHLKLWGPLHLHTSLQLLSAFLFLTIIYWCFKVVEVSVIWVVFLRHTFPVSPPDKFYSVTWCVWPLVCVSGSITRSITLHMKSNETCFSTGTSSECIGFFLTLEIKVFEGY